MSEGLRSPDAVAPAQPPSKEVLDLSAVVVAAYRCRARPAYNRTRFLAGFREARRAEQQHQDTETRYREIADAAYLAGYLEGIASVRTDRILTSP